MDDVLQIPHVAGRAVYPCDHQHVALTQKLEQRRKLFSPLGACAGDLLLPDDGAAGRRECGVLNGKSRSMVLTRAYP